MEHPPFRIKKHPLKGRIQSGPTSGALKNPGRVGSTRVGAQHSAQSWGRKREDAGLTEGDREGIGGRGAEKGQTLFPRKGSKNLESRRNRRSNPRLGKEKSKELMRGRRKGQLN